ncbi:holin [Emergencia sp. 1XD21-10]|uniref:holin n=1 Tax=Emergencia sp. 1XD21-10 TaxID=2304569 RepID=UPI001FABC767|nr:holin [Emergencia sp. 1XD21-10]
MKKWIKAASIRAVKTMAQTAAAMVGTSMVLEEVSWMTVASAAVLAGILSLLTSLKGLPEVESEEV